MANDLTRNPWILDTPASITTAPVRPSRVRWVSVSAAQDDTVVLQDNPPVQKANVAYGNTDNTPRNVLELLASGADTDPPEKTFSLETVWNGLKLTTISSGKVYVWYR